MVILKSKNQKFYQHKRSISIQNKDIEKIVEISFDEKGFKYFIGYKDVTNLDLLT